MAIVHLRILPASTHYQFSSHFHILHIYYTSIPVPVTKICMFPMPAVTNPHRSGSLKNNRPLFSHISEGRILNQSVVRFHTFWRLYGRIHSLSLLVAAVIPWLEATSFQSLPPSSQSFLLCETRKDIYVSLPWIHTPTYFQCILTSSYWKWSLKNKFTVMHYIYLLDFDSLKLCQH